jgi:hypothetical protein
MVSVGMAKAGFKLHLAGLKEHIQEVLVVFFELFVAFAAEEAHVPLDFGVVAHGGEAAIFVLDVKRGDGNSFGNLVKIRIIAAKGAGNSH